MTSQTPTCLSLSISSCQCLFPLRKRFLYAFLSVEPIIASSHDGQDAWLEELRKCERSLQRPHALPYHYIHYVKSLHSLGLSDTLLTIVQSAVPSLHSHFDTRVGADGGRGEREGREGGEKREGKREEKSEERRRGSTSLSRSLAVDWWQWRREDVRYLLQIGAQTAASLGRWDTLNDVASSCVDFHLSSFSSRVGQVCEFTSVSEYVSVWMCGCMSV